MSAFIFFVIELILFYCGSRMEFVLFEMIATGNTVIAPMWRRYGRHTWKWIGFKILLMVVGLLTCLACIAPLFLSLFRHPHMEHVGALTFLKIFLPIFIAIMLLCLVLYLAWDFVLPIMALEGPIVFRSVRKALEIFGEAPGAFWGYVFMRLMLGIATGISFLVAWILAIVAGAIPLAIIGLLAYFSLHHAGTSGVVVLTMLYVLLAVVGFAYLILSYIVMGGMMAIFMQSYAAYFYGGRYQPLGDLLEPPIAPVAPYEAAPPVDDVPPMFPPPETVG
ncbi:MAG: hypothetical protein P4L10_01810 [Acidobacteriaceae bacterium]|nr:hypothetical protein [Acidobacteriaceae bacterium]